MLIVGTCFGHLRMSSMKRRSHSTSSPLLSKAINSDSIVDRAITVCLEDFHDTAAPVSVNTYSIVDFEFLALDIQIASQYPSNIIGYLV